MMISHLRPMQGFQTFTRYTNKTVVSSKGRAGGSSLAESGFIYGILSRATPEEREQWGTTESPVTHKIVQRGTVNAANDKDVLQLGDRYFDIQKPPRNPGDLGHFTVYFCEERKGLNG